MLRAMVLFIFKMPFVFDFSRMILLVSSAAVIQAFPLSLGRPHSDSFLGHSATPTLAAALPPF